MKKVGKEVFFRKAELGNPRSGEGAFARLNNGTIAYYYSKFIGDSASDFATADIYALYSDDEGETWYGDEAIIKGHEEYKNCMCVSTMRMNNGDLGLFYGTKLKKDGVMGTMMWLVRSSDEGKTWSDRTPCLDKFGYFVTNNDRVIRLKNGRLLFPASKHEVDEECHEGVDLFGTVCMFASDDDGVTWREIGERKTITFPGMVNKGAPKPGIIKNDGLQEPGVYQLEDESIMSWARTNMGFQYTSISEDNGVTWTDPIPNTFFTSPESPMQIKKVGNYTIAVFNPTPRYTGRKETAICERTPYICAVSENDGKEFKRIYYLEDDLTHFYHYPAIFAGEGYFLVAYYHSYGHNPLHSAKIVKVSLDEIKD